MNKEEIIIYVYSTPHDMRECFKLYNDLFEKQSCINCYGILKNGIKIQFTTNVRGLRNVKTYYDIKDYLNEMLLTQLQQENKQLKDNWNKLKVFVRSKLDLEEAVWEISSKINEIEKGNNNE